ncbi:MAG: transporter substrate-binding protein [Hyphomicrobiales bacterium]|nr:transporter substrate-binding protein [Hyphomicrobiales bacterium]
MLATMTRTAFAACMLALAATPAPAQQKLTDVKIVYPAPSSTTWPIWVAKEAGYFEKHGLNMTVQMGIHPAGPAAVVSGEALTHNLGLDTSMLAAMRGGQIVIVGAPLHIASFVMMGAKNLTDIKAVAGKRVAVGRVGDPPYFYAKALFETLKIDDGKVQWVGAGSPPQRALSLRNGLADAAMLTPPDYYRLEEDGFKVLARLSDYREIAIATSYMWRRKTVAEQPELVEAVLKAHAEAVKRFYEDKAFGMAVIQKYAKLEEKDLSRLYDETVAAKTFERIPYVPTAAVKDIIERNKDTTPELATFDFRKAIDQTPIDKLVDSGFYEQLFGPGIKDEIARARAASFR